MEVIHMSKKMCDFCLEESKSWFNLPAPLPDGHRICKKCRAKIDKYGLTPKYDLFPILITADPHMREMIMGDYLESHKDEDIIAKFFPLPNNLLHDSEHCINVRDAKIRVSASLIPAEDTVTQVADIKKKYINNLPTAQTEEDSVLVSGTLYETDAALYFMSQKFINCHRLTSIVRENQGNDQIVVLEHGKKYIYIVENADLFHMRDTFFNKAAARDARKKNLIYLASENTMTLTSGVYSVPKNISSGTYWVNPLDNSVLSIRDATGKIHDIPEGERRIYIDNGSTLEVTGQYQFRFNRHEEEEAEQEEDE